jgi:hypothetical protein
MKLSKFARLVKQTGLLYLFHVSGGGVWLGTHYGFYRASGLPDTVDDSTILAILDFDTKAAMKIIVHEENINNERDIFGFDLSDDHTPDIEAKKFSVAAVYKGTFATALLCDDGELVFYDEAHLAPLADVLKESNYVQTVVRVNKKGVRYVVIRDGLETVAGIMPMQIISKEFLGDLQEFQARCTEQYFREESRRTQDTPPMEDDVE